MAQHPVQHHAMHARWLSAAARMRRAASLTLVSAALAVAPGATAIAQTTRDSSGVRIVENTRPLLATSRAWRVDARPLLDLGGVDGDTLHEFNLVMGVAKLSDGRIAVANQGSGTILFFDASGRFVGHAGRKGQGPGEFEQILGMSRIAGDTLAVIDLEEVEYFTGEGKHVRRGAARGLTPQYIYPGAFLSSGAYVGLDGNDFDRNEPPGRAVSTLPLVRVSSDGAKSELLGRFPARMGSPMYGVSFAPTAHIATTGTAIWYSFGDRYEVARLDASGRVEMIVRRSVALRPVTDEMKEARRQFVLNGTGEDGRPWPASMRARLEASLAKAIYVERLPATSAIRTDPAGNLWVRIYDYRESFVPGGPVRADYSRGVGVGCFQPARRLALHRRVAAELHAARDRNGLRRRTLARRRRRGTRAPAQAGEAVGPLKPNNVDRLVDRLTRWHGARGLGSASALSPNAVRSAPRDVVRGDHREQSSELITHKAR